MMGHNCWERAFYSQDDLYYPGNFIYDYDSSAREWTLVTEHIGSQGRNFTGFAGQMAQDGSFAIVQDTGSHNVFASTPTVGQM